MAVTIPLPTADEAMAIAINRTSRKHSATTLAPGKKIMVMQMTLGADVTPADYRDMAVGIMAIDGIEMVRLLIDGAIPDDALTGREYKLHIDAQLRSDKVAEAEE